MENFKKNLKKAGVKIITEFNDQLVPEFIVNFIPGKKVVSNGSRRKNLFDFEPFFIKDVDSGKTGPYGSTKIQEALEEVKRSIYFKHDKIKIAQKIAILYLQDKCGEVFLVEEKVFPYNQEDWEKLGLIEETRVLCDLAQKDIKEGHEEFTIQNIGYNQEKKELKFYDVFPIR